MLVHLWKKNITQLRNSCLRHELQEFICLHFWFWTHQTSIVKATNLPTLPSKCVTLVMSLLTQSIRVWYIYIYIYRYHTNQPNIGKYNTIHGSYGLWKIYSCHTPGSVGFPGLARLESTEPWWLDKLEFLRQTFSCTFPGSPKTQLCPLVVGNPSYRSSQRLFFVWSWTSRVSNS